MTQRLATLDTGFLHAEDADRHTSVGIGGLAILDGPMPDQASLMSTLGERIAACPRFAQRLRRRIFDLAAPEWVDDDAFDLAHHVRRVAVPAPTDDDLFQVVADVMSWRLDRDRPLWEIWVIEGLSDNRWAMLMKVHPCLADAIATVHIMTGLSDNGMSEAAAVDRCISRHPSGSVLSAPPLQSVPPAPRPGGWLDPVRASAQIVAGAVGAARQALQSSGELAVGLLRPVSSRNGPITSRRRYSAARVALSDVRQICKTFDVTINDVALAALTESYRKMLVRRGENPRPDSLRSLVPMSMSAPDGQHPTDTRRSVMLPYLPVEQDNPLLQLRMVHTRLARMKATAPRQVGDVVAAATRVVPFALTSWAMQVLSRLPQRNAVTLVVNVPGPSRPLQIMGCNIASVLPIPPIALQLRTGVAILSYAGELFFGVLADFNTVADADELARGIETAVARLLVRAKRHRVARDRHGLALVVTA